MKFSKILKDMRLEKGLTHEELSRKIGFSKAIIGFWENEKSYPNALALVALADFFQVSTDYLLGIEDEAGISIVSTNLSDEEQRLIDYYRALPPELRAGVMSYTQTFYEMDKQSKRGYN